MRKTPMYLGILAVLVLACAAVILQTERKSMYTHIDLSNVCNMGFRDEVGGDRKGGWTDQGPTRDFERMPIGLQKCYGVTFNVIDPGKNSGKSCIVLRGNHKSKPYFPEDAVIAPINKKARSLYFLHSCAWGYGNKTDVVASYTIQYEDGSTREIPLRRQIEINDWFNPLDGERSLSVLRGLNRITAVGLDMLPWRNPCPEKKITSITFRTGRTHSVPILVAITLSDKDIDISPKFTERVPLDRSHPYLFFKESDIPSLRRKCTKEPFRGYYDDLIKFCDSLLDIPPTEPIEAESGIGYGGRARLEVVERLVSLSFAYVMSRDARYLERAKEEAFHVIDSETMWVNPDHVGQICDLATGEIGYGIGVTYDMLYQDLTEDERKRFIDGIQKKGFSRFLEGTKTIGWWLKTYSNWSGVVNGGSGVAALAFINEIPDAGKVLHVCRNQIELYSLGLADDGGWNEGVGYWHYGMFYAVTFHACLERVLGTDDGFFKQKALRNTGYFPLYFNPSGVTCSFGDVSDRGAGALLYYLGERYPSAEVIEYADRFIDGNSTRWGTLVMRILWRPEKVPAARTAMKNMKIFRGIQWATLSSGWPDPAVYMAFKSGNLGASHTHLDLNSFQLVAWGERLLVDIGNPKYTSKYFTENRWDMYMAKSEGHNCLLVDGKGQFPEMEGSITSDASSENREYLIGDVSTCYGDNIELCKRHVLFQNKRYFVLLDEVKTKQEANIEIRFHTFSQASINGQTATIAGDNSRAFMAFSGNISVKVTMLRNPERLKKAEQVIRVRSKGRSTSTELVSIVFPYQKGEEEPDCLIRQTNDSITISVNMDTIRFTKDKDGVWRLVTE